MKLRFLKNLKDTIYNKRIVSLFIAQKTHRTFIPFMGV